jgi:hypothetical protein
MDAFRVSTSLPAHLDSLSRDLETLFKWKPSTRFLHRVRLFALSLGPSNHADLMALILCEAADSRHTVTHVERETDILRAVDRERQRWRREAERVQSLEHDPPSQAEKPTDREGRRIDAADLADQIRRFVSACLSEVDQKIYLARFEQGLEYREVKQVLEDRYTEDNLRQRAVRIRKQILDFLKRNRIDISADFQ